MKEAANCDGLDLFSGTQLQDFGRAFFPKAAVTSSFLMRAPGVPGWLRFCSSVPSPIIPLCLSVDFLSAEDVGLFVMGVTPCAGVPDLNQAAGQWFLDCFDYRGGCRDDSFALGPAFRRPA